jgi:hypothetical protein
LAALTAHAAITRTGDGYRLTLAVQRNGSERESHFESQSCAPLLKAATLVLALAFGDGTEPKPARAARTPARSSSAPEAERDVGAESRETRPEPARLRLLPWAGAVTSSGFVGPRALGAEVGLGLGSRYWTSFVRAYGFGPRVAAERDGVTAELSAALGALGGCGGMAWARLRVDGCLAFAVGAVRAHSRGAEHDGFVTLPWLALAPSLAALVPLPHPFALRAELALELPLAAARYDVAPLGTLYAASRIVPRSSLGIAVEL